MSALLTFAVFGNPVAHSRSPVIHQAFARQFDVSLDYQKRLAPLDGFRQAVEQFFAEGGSGANVTLPFKEEAFRLCRVTTQRAKTAGAVNTLWQIDGELHGDNTDGIGLVRDMTVNLGWQLQGKSVLILGAGGAVRGIIDPLAEAGVAQITVANRTLERARTLAADMQLHGRPVNVMPLDRLSGQHDIIINAISAGLQGDVPDLPGDLGHENSGCYDLLYGTATTPFVRWAEQQGYRNRADGLGMLVEQAAASFERWLALTPSTSRVIQGLRNGSLV